MKSRQRRRPVRPLTIYGFRRGRPKSRRLWLALLVLASLSVLPRVLSPIAERFWGESAHPHATPVRLTAPAAMGRSEAGNAFASAQPETAASSEAPTDSTASVTPAPRAEAPGVQRAPVPPARPALHRPRAGHGQKAGSATRPRQGQGLVPAP
jgi:hypothetical protein